MLDNLKNYVNHIPILTKLHGSKKGMKSPLIKRCLIKFSIGKTYKDEVWCDVIPMDVCHLLLGRPWQYDRKGMHDGGKNTYTFWNDGTKVILFPLKDEGKIENTLSKKGIVK